MKEVREEPCRCLGEADSEYNPRAGPPPNTEVQRLEKAWQAQKATRRIPSSAKGEMRGEGRARVRDSRPAHARRPLVTLL